MESIPSSTKRTRPASDEEDSVLSGESPENSQEFKRLRRVTAEAFPFDLFDDEDSAESQDIDGNLASVMHSLEQEIRSGSGSPGSKIDESTGVEVLPVNSETVASVKELGYLLEASDDELGIPPAMGESQAITGDVIDLDDGTDVAEAATLYGHMWGFDDDIGFGSDFGFKPVMNDEVYGVVEYDDVGLFDHSEPSDLTWRTMPAV